uniref:C2 domain-containing protein n=1 Tax=Leersia perrieri TaxID=77586 RepID=A0A0D9VMK5_9ORYZ
MSAADGCASPPSPSTPSSTLLEVTVISAQDLHRRFGHRRVRAFAVAWADEAHKLRTGVDLASGADPTWNDRFLFRVDDSFLRSDTAAVTVEVRSPRRILGGDAVLGVTRIVVSTFVGMSSASSATTRRRQVAALQLRRPRSLRPQGIVNVAVALLDGGGDGAAESPDAFSVKDLVARRPGSLARIAEVTDAEEAAAADDPTPATAAAAPAIDGRGSAVEQKKLEMTLEKWKADLSPEQQKGGNNCRRKHRRRSSCFGGGGGGGGAEWER